MIINSEFIQKLEPFVEFVTHCPEVEIGLGVPRKWIRIVMEGDAKTLVQPATGADLTRKMADYIKETIPSLPAIDGFILREGSPSCSMSRVRYYAGPEKGAKVAGTGPGLFGEAVLSSFAGLPIESDGRLRNQKIREVFLTKIFAISALRGVESSGKMRELVEYHSRNKYSFMTYGQSKLKELGRIVANRDNLPFDEVIVNYRAKLLELFGTSPRSTSVINVLNKVYGYFSKSLSKVEKDRYHQQVALFRRGQTTLTSLREMLMLWGLRFDEDYITSQTFFQPFPNELNEFCKVDAFQS